MFEQAPKHHIGIAPGATFSSIRCFGHFIRIQYGAPWSSQIDANIRRLGQIVVACAR